MLPTDTVRPSQRYWDIAAETYDSEFSETLIAQIMRRRVWRELDRAFLRGDRVLELNCGTGVDAVHLAKRKVNVTACDISPQMIECARQRSLTLPVALRPEFRVLPTEELFTSGGKEMFDGAFSNFSGLNCVEDLKSVSRELARLLVPGAPFIVCMLGKFVPWEVAWYLAHAAPKTALRRLGSNARENVGEPDKPVVRYYSRREMMRVLAPQFRLHHWRGIGTTLPPTYMQAWARRFPGVAHLLGHIDSVLENIPPFRGAAGFMLLHFRRTQERLP